VLFQAIHPSPSEKGDTKPSPSYHKYYPLTFLNPFQVNSRVNDENFDREYEAESNKAEAVAGRLQEIEAGMMKQIFPSATDKVELQ